MYESIAKLCKPIHENVWSEKTINKNSSTPSFKCRWTSQSIPAMYFHETRINEATRLSD